MRITANFLSMRAMQNLQRAMGNIEKPQREITTGKRVNRPSDDPVDAASIVSIKATHAGLDQYMKNTANALEWMNATSSTLESVTNILDEVDGLISTLGDPVTSAERENAKSEVDMLLAELLSAANRKYLGKFLFGGNETRTEPFTASYTGDDITSVEQNPAGIDGVRTVRVSEVDTLAVNVPGDSLFQPGGPGADDDVFDILVDLRTALLNNDSSGMAQVGERLDETIKRIDAENASLGGSIRRLEDVQLRLDNDKLLTDERRSRLEDADIAQAMLDYNQAELVYQAALSATSNIIQMSLANFIR